MQTLFPKTKNLENRTLVTLRSQGDAEIKIALMRCKSVAVFRTIVTPGTNVFHVNDVKSFNSSLSPTIIIAFRLYYSSDAEDRQTRLLNHQTKQAFVSVFNHPIGQVHASPLIAGV